MKFAMIFLVAVAAVAPPKISLNLEGMTGAYKLKNSIVRNTGAMQPNGDKVLSRQDWTEKCPALRHCPQAFCSKNDWVYTSRKNCPFPIAKAYDHQDKHVDVTTRVYLVDVDGTPVKKRVALKDVKFDKRATYLMKFDAKDTAGNKAEQVVFALILDDLQAPFFNKGCHSKAITVEAVSDWKPCIETGYDNVDSKITVDYKVDYVTMGSSQGYGNYNKLVRYFGRLSKLGKYLITSRLTDNAGIYGVATDASGNTRTRVQAVLIRDTRVPTLYLGGSDPTYVECHKVAYTSNYRKWGYNSARSNCKDQLDTVALGKFLPTTTTLGAAVNVVPSKKAPTWSPAIANAVRTMTAGEKVTQRTIDYTCHDTSGNAAAPRSRVIKTVDTQQPTLTLLGHKGEELDSDTHIVIYEANSRFVDPGAVAEDSCDSSIDSNDIKRVWGGRPFNKNVLGDYVRTYSVTDAVGNTATKTRTFTVVDNAVPIIERIGEEIETVEATRDSEYSDKGATCTDKVDGDISHAIEVSGEVINMRIPGSYKVVYNCQDLSGNAAVVQYRTVVVQDTIIPKLKLTGTQITYVESGFPYKDAGATATDTLDGDLTKYIWTDGDTVNVAKAWYSKRSCQEILDAWKEGNYDAKNGVGIKYVWERRGWWWNLKTIKYPKSGTYYITSEKKDGKFVRVPVKCIFDQTYAGIALTYHLHQEGDEKTCGAFGMRKLSTMVTRKYYICRRWRRFWWWTWCTSYEIKTKQYSDPHSYEVRALLTDYIRKVSPEEDYLMLGDLDQYVCVTKFLADGHPQRTNYIGGEDNQGHQNYKKYANGKVRGDYAHITNAEQGKYVIQFNVEDKAGNEAKRLYRTVIVKDTLPPVITLHLKGKLVHTSDHSQKGVSHDRISGIYQKGSNPQFNTKGIDLKGKEYMAESATTNGWLIGAVASAVAGVALLGLSAKKTATTVPV